MTRALLKQLQSPAGEQALVSAEAILASEPDFLRAAQRLAAHVPGPLARAAVEQAELRRRAVAKFEAPGELFYVREALEQATAEPVARHRAQRFEGATMVVELGCGLGGDTLSLAAVSPVIAVDVDPLRLDLVRANAARRGILSKVMAVRADARDRFLQVPRGALGFADPSRRRQGRRTRQTSATDPPLREILGWLPDLEGMAIKVSPAVDLDELADLHCEVEFVSLDGQLREATLWFGRLKRGDRTATVLPAGDSLEAAGAPALAVGPLGAFLVEPDPAVMRAGSVGFLGQKIGGRLVSPGIAFLSLDVPVHTPYGRTYRVLQSAPFRLKTLQAWLAENGIGRLTIKRRGSPVEPEVIEGKLKLAGEREGTIVLTRIAGASSMILVEPVTGAP